VACANSLVPIEINCARIGADQAMFLTRIFSINQYLVGFVQKLSRPCINKPNFRRLSSGKNFQRRIKRNGCGCDTTRQRHFWHRRKLQEMVSSSAATTVQHHQRKTLLIKPSKMQSEKRFFGRNEHIRELLSRG
jgi:hypothetical protein